MNEKELIETVGGAITATWFNSISRIIDTICDLGRTVGTAINMIFSGRRC